MTWVTLVSIAIVCLLSLNSLYVVFWLRPKLGVTPKPPSDARKQQLSPVDLLALSLLTLALLAGTAAPIVAPESSLGKWIETYGLINYLVWCMAVNVLLFVAIRLLGKRFNRTDAT